MWTRKKIYQLGSLRGAFGGNKSFGVDPRKIFYDGLPRSPAKKISLQMSHDRLPNSFQSVTVSVFLTGHIMIEMFDPDVMEDISTIMWARNNHQSELEGIWESNL